MRLAKQLGCTLVACVISLLVPSVRPQGLPVPGVTIVLPPRLSAGAPATLAVLGFDGHLAPNVTVQIGSVGHVDQYVTTDATGRAAFTTPGAAAGGGALIAQAAGSSAAALIDA